MRMRKCGTVHKLHYDINTYAQIISIKENHKTVIQYIKRFI